MNRVTFPPLLRLVGFLFGAAFLFLVFRPVEGEKADPEQIVKIARSLVGTPYLFGGSDPTGFDCSGLTQYVYGKVGISLPRTTRNQFNELPSVEDLRPGDLVFFNPDGDGITHVGIYLGSEEFVHAPSSGKIVRISRLDSPYWKERFVGARRP